MGKISPNTFNQAKQYVNVRLQQGVPIVDADWNEMDDIRKHEHQTFLQAFVGNGVPQDSNSFQVQAADLENDFQILGGTPEQPGLCLVDGWEIQINETVNYTAQRLYGDDDLADSWQVAHLESLTTPNAARTDIIYLDAWERLVDSNEDPDLLNPLINIETCLRRKREWVVRVSEGNPLPEPPTGHVYYPLAYLTRPVSQASISADQLTDLRKPMAMARQNDVEQIAADAFGTGYQLDQDGQPNLAKSLLAQVQELQNGTTNSDKDLQQIATDAYGADYFLDHDGQPNLSVNLTEQINRSVQDLRQVATDAYGASYSLDHDGQPNLGINLAEQINRSVNNLNQVVADAFGPYELYDNGQPQLSANLRKAINAILSGQSLTTDDKTIVSVTGLTSSSSTKLSSLTTKAGPLWLFYWYLNQIRYKRYDFSRGQWSNEESLTTTTEECYYYSELFSVEDNNNHLWVFWRVGRTNNEPIWYRKWDGNQWSSATKVANVTVGTNYHTSLVFTDINGNIWLFWRENTTVLKQKYYSTTTKSWETEVTVPIRLPSIQSFSAVGDGQGQIWVAWSTYKDGYNHIFYQRYNPTDKSWTPETQLTTDVANNYFPFLLLDYYDNDYFEIWIFWRSNRNGEEDIWYQRYYYYSSNKNYYLSTEASLGTQVESPSVNLVIKRYYRDIWVFFGSYYQHFYNDQWRPTQKLYSQNAVVDNQENIWTFNSYFYNVSNNNYVYQIGTQKILFSI